MISSSSPLPECASTRSSLCPGRTCSGVIEAVLWAAFSECVAAASGRVDLPRSPAPSAGSRSPAARGHGGLTRGASSRVPRGAAIRSGTGRPGCRSCRAGAVRRGRRTYPEVGGHSVLVAEGGEVPDDHLVGLLAQGRPFVEEVGDLVPERPHAPSLGAGHLRVEVASLRRSSMAISSTKWLQPNCATAPQSVRQRTPRRTGSCERGCVGRSPARNRRSIVATASRQSPPLGGPVLLEEVPADEAAETRRKTGSGIRPTPDSPRPKRQSRAQVPDEWRERA